MDFISALLLLLLVMDPLGNVPLFMVVLQNTDPAKRRAIILREMMFALIVLVGAFFVGPRVMEVLGLENIALQLAGGVVLFIIAIHMIFPGESPAGLTADADPWIVPLAIPLVAGPSTIATILLLSSQHQQQRMEILLALCCAWAVTAVTLTLSTSLSNLLGKKGLRAVERLMGMVLIMVATQMFISGVRTFLVSIKKM